MKRRVTFNRMVTGVESVTIMVDNSVDIKSMTVEDAHDLIDQAIWDNTCVVELELLETERPHSASDVNGSLDLVE